MRSVFTLLFVLSLLPLGAQVRIQADLHWAAAARIVEWAGERQTQFGYRSEVQIGGVGADAGEMFWAEKPGFVRTFAATGPSDYTVEVISTNFEALNAKVSAEDYPEKLQFTVSVSRQPGGYLGKISAPTIIRGPGGLQRLTSFDIRLVPDHRKVDPRQTFATNSVLRQGEWFRINVEQRGVHKIGRDFLTNTLKVNLDGLDPRSIALFGHPSSGPLPETVNNPAPDDLVEIPILLEGEADGSFDGEDALLFYAYGPDGQSYDAVADRFRHDKNIYTTTNTYFLRIGGAPGSRVGQLPSASRGTPTDSYDALYHFEEDEFNVLHSLGGNSHGSSQKWYGDFFKAARDKTYDGVFHIPGLVPSAPARFEAVMALRTNVSSHFFAELGGERLRSSRANRVSTAAPEQRNAFNEARIEADVSLSSENVTVKIDYPIPAGAELSVAWLDYFSLRARRQLLFGNLSQFDFRDTETRDDPTVTFRFQDLPNDAVVWRIDGADVRAVTLTNQQFSAPAGGRAFEYVAFRSTGQLLSPTGGSPVDNQNLHSLNSADLLIVAHPEFLSQAEDLAEHRRSFSGLETVVATTEQVYNEFSSGRDDVAAIRNFAFMLSERSPGFRYLLLFGDGSFDHRNLLGLGTTFIPTYQHSGRPTQVGSFPADDFYGIFSPATNGQPLEPDLSIGVGRLPVKTGDEATQLVKKLIRYDTDPSIFGDWRTRMTFVGDDEDRGIHTYDVNRVANAVSAIRPALNFDKLYFDLFPQQSISAGDRYPDISEGLDRAVFRGALAVTYLGHGGPRGWAQERVLTIPQIRNWNRPANADNPIQPPIFITATCTFSNYDDASFVSAGEEALLTPNGGAAALLTTTRPVFANENYILTKNTVTAMMNREDGEWRRLGDIVRIAKNSVTSLTNERELLSSTENARKFTLLGDPTMKIALPEYSVRTTAIDGMALDTARRDTARALQRISISGEVVDLNGNLLSDFNGEVYPTVYDKPVNVSTLGQETPVTTIKVQRSIIFRGRATVSNGQFNFEFVVPRDIDYEFGAGKISYYAADPSQFVDAAGYYDKLFIGGTSSEGLADNEGPNVEVFMNNTEFMSGGRVNADPVLLVQLSDDLGINVTGNSIGHDLEAIIDEDTRNSIVLNDYYEADVDDFRRGEVRYPLFDLEPGMHTITVRAWDVANNNTQATTEFIVAESGADAIHHVLNYPNPFTDRTCFQFDHTLVGQEVEALIQIYTVNGRLVKTLEKDFSFSDGTVRRDDCVEWDGLDDFGERLGRGVYLYQVRLRGDGNNVVDGALEKLVILK